MRALHAVTAIFLGLTAGCYSATIHMSAESGRGIPAIPEAWHVSLLGVFELSDPVSIGVCNVTDIEEHESLLGSLVAWYLGIEIMDTTVNCPFAGGQPPPFGAQPPVPMGGPPGTQPPSGM